MKKLFLTLSLLPSLAFAQIPGGYQLTPENLAKVQQSIQQMDANQLQSAMGLAQCIQRDVSMDGMQKMERWGGDVDAKIRELCSSGQRDAAQKYAVDSARSMSKTSEYQAMNSCMNQYKGGLQQNPSFASLQARVDAMQNQNGQHVCGAERVSK